MSKRSHFRHFKAVPETIRLAVMLHVRFALSFRNVESPFLNERDVELSHKTVRFCWNRFGLFLRPESDEASQNPAISEPLAMASRRVFVKENDSIFSNTRTVSRAVSDENFVEASWAIT